MHSSLDSNYLHTAPENLVTCLYIGSSVSVLIMDMDILRMLNLKTGVAHL